MKFLTISDNVLPQLENAENLQRVYSEVAAVISCGDMPAPYIEYITSMLNVPLLYVKGNHDIYYEPGVPGGDNLDEAIVDCCGVTFAGLEGCIRYNREPLQYTENEMLTKVLRLWPKILVKRARTKRRLDVMVTHSPPRDIHDLPDHAHRGFKCFRLMLRLYKPRYLIHGHVDTHDNRRTWMTHYEETDVYNINPVKLMSFD